MRGNISNRDRETGYHREMAVSSHRFSRRSLLASGCMAVAGFAAESGPKGEVFPSEWKRYSDPATDLEVFRLTEPAYSSMLPAYSNRIISRNSGFLLYTCDRTGSP